MGKTLVYQRIIKLTGRVGRGGSHSDKRVAVVREKADEDGRVLAGISYRGLLFVINLLCVSGEKQCEDRSLG